MVDGLQLRPPAATQAAGAGPEIRQSRGSGKETGAVSIQGLRRTV